MNEPPLQFCTRRLAECKLHIVQAQKEHDERDTAIGKMLANASVSFWLGCHAAFEEMIAYHQENP